jgi:hypothetical protein
MLFTGIFAVCSEPHINYINALCGLNEFMNVKLVVYIAAKGTSYGGA